MNILQQVALVFVVLAVMLIPFTTADLSLSFDDLISPGPIDLGSFGDVTPYESGGSEALSGMLIFTFVIGLLFLGFLFPQGKSGQITLFIILALIILFIFGFLIYLQTLTAPGEEDETPVEALLDTQAFTNLVQSCFDQSLIEGLSLVGKQGGFIWKDQGGIHDKNRYKGRDEIVPVYFDSTGENHDLAYAVLDKNTLNPDTYPYGQMQAIPRFSTFSKRWYGELRTGFDASFPPLCSKDGGNANFSDVNDSCRWHGVNSIQSTLESFVLASTQSCLNFNSLENQGYGIDGSEGVVTILVGESGVMGKFDYAVNLTLPTGASESKVFDFFSQQPVRLHYVYELAREQMLRDIRDIYFRLGDSEDQLDTCRNYFIDGDTHVRDRRNETSCLRDGLSVIYPPVGAEINQNLCLTYYHPDTGETKHCRNAHLMQIKDEGGFLNGEPFSFYFLYENRAPVLNLIDYRIDAGSSTFIRIVQGNHMADGLLGVDPDDTLEDGTNLPDWRISVYPQTLNQVMGLGRWNVVGVSELNVDISQGVHDGVYTTHVTVRDLEGLSDTQTFELCVGNVC